MLGSVDLHRFQRRNGGSDGVCPNIRLLPAPTLFKVDQVAKIDGAWITRCLKDESRWIRDNDHRVRFGKKEACLFKRRA